MICCLCGERGAEWCSHCHHAFCELCRTNLQRRAKAFLREWAGLGRPIYCAHDRMTVGAQHG